jgi:hypothetical protein
MGPAAGALVGLLALWATVPQTPPHAFRDVAALLDAVAKAYAADAETFRMESITESVSSQESRRSWRKSAQTVQLTLLVDAQGRIAYAGIGGEDEAGLRKAIAGLVSEPTR